MYWCQMAWADARSDFPWSAHQLRLMAEGLLFGLLFADAARTSLLVCDLL